MMAACTPAATEAPVVEEPAAAEAPAAEAPAAAIKVAVVAGGEIGDMGFIDSANGGLQRMVNELGLETMIITNHDDNNNNLDILLSAAEEADLIFVIPGYFFDEQLKEVVPQFPNKTFVYVDGVTTIEGMVSVSFKQNEGAFLAGALAALMTTQTDALANADDATVVGFMGGADMPVIHDYQVGFDQGAKYAVDGITVIDQYAGTHFDAAIGKETALAMYSQGADIIFQAAGPTGLGLFEAAKEAKKYAIGVDTNQKGLAVDWVLASMRKNVGDSIFQFTQAFIAGEIKAGDARAYGLAEGGVGIDYGGMDPDLVPQEIKDKIAEYAQMIIDGKIVVDTYTAE
ncbi:MAG: BMP family ABC transporter substrate-binding protein [Anaerolineaceae bacterium]